MNNWLKVLIKCELEKKILLVKRLIVTEKDKRYI